MIRFLADESCDFAMVRALRSHGYDVLTVVEVAQGADDEKVMRLARREGKILLTEDKDFGRLAYAEGMSGMGVILLRYPAWARTELADDLVRLVTQRGEELANTFVVMQPRRIRIRRKRL